MANSLNKKRDASGFEDNWMESRCILEVKSRRPNSVFCVGGEGEGVMKDDFRFWFVQLSG